MDDVDAELDRGRINLLLEYLKDRTQTFISTSKGDLIKEFAGNAKVFDVRNGVALDVTAKGGAEVTIEMPAESI